MDVSIVVPVYNSSKILQEAYMHFKKEIEKVTKNYEILFRNDGSKDDSEEVLEQISKLDDRVKIFTNFTNKGLGYTLRNLFNDAIGEHIIYFDADAFLSFELEILPFLLKKMETKDVIIASRYVKNPEVPFYRWIASEVYNLINKILFGIDIRDIGSGFVIFKNKAIKNVNLISDGFDIHIEIYSKLKRKNYQIEEIPINYKHWKGGSFDVLKHGPKTLFNTLKLWFKMLKNN